jgi:small subunit ribosomal protein S1
MSQQHGRESQIGPQVDDGYWTALFRMEEAFAADEATLAGADEASPDTESVSVSDEVAAPVQPAGPRAALPPNDPWHTAQETMDADRTLRLRVVGHNKGGLLVYWNGLQGFVPASQLIDFPQFHVPRERLQALASWQDRELSLKIIEVNRGNSRLILSERATLVAAEQREVLLLGVRPGEKRQGTVTNLTDFGAFVDLGGLEGLIHISEISWSRVTHPSTVLRPGQKVQVLVLSVDKSAERVALSMKRLHNDPWQDVESRYRPDQLVRGVVGNVTTYGAFVILEEELEGLIHISELAEGMFMHPRDVVRTGQEVTARVLSVDGRHKRLALSLRAVGQGAAPDATAGA